MKVLVDRSVWCAAFAKTSATEAPAVTKLRKHVERGRVVLLGLVVQEVLQRFRHERDVQRIAKLFEPFPMIQLAREDHVEAAQLHRVCRKRGITASTVDCHIASAAIRHRCRLLSIDRDFEHIANVSPLRLA